MKKDLILTALLYITLQVPLKSQIDYLESNILCFFSGGYGFYTPSDKIKTAFKEAYSYDYGNYGGIFVGAKYLNKTDLISSRLKLGGEATVQVFRSEADYQSLVGNTLYVYGRGETFLNGNQFKFLVDLFLFKTGRFNFHFENGLGMMLLTSNIDDVPFQPVLEGIYSPKIFASYSLPRLITIDAQAGILKGFSDNKIFSINAGLGFSFCFNKT